MDDSLELSPQMESAIKELKAMILARFPDAQFNVAPAIDEPESIHIITTVDVDDTEEVLDLVIDRVIDLIVEEGIPVHVIPVRPLERVLAKMKLPAART
jgi:hypothetical protein